MTNKIPGLILIACTLMISGCEKNVEGNQAVLKTEMQPIAAKSPDAPTSEKTGQFAIPPQFQFAGEFKNGLASVRMENGKYGYVDVAGKVVIPATFDNAGAFHGEGLAVVRIGDWKSGKDGVINRLGEYVVNPQYAVSYGYQEGRLAVRIGDSPLGDGKWGFLDTEGKLIIPAQFDKVSSFSEGMALVRIGDEDTGKWGFIDINGKYLINPQYQAATPVSEGIFLYRMSEDEKIGIADKFGTVIVEPKFLMLGKFEEGLSILTVGTKEYPKYGFVDKAGRVVVDPIYDGATPFSEGLSAVRVGDKKTGKWGYIDSIGKIVIPPQFSSNQYGRGPGSFYQGLAKVRIGDEKTGSVGFIDKQGKMVINPQFAPHMGAVGDFSEGLAAVQVGDEDTGLYGYIHR